jgi:hypothetical protein
VTGRGGENAVIPDYVDTGRRNESGELFQQFQRFESDVCRAVTPAGLQGTHGDNELSCNSLPLFELTTKVVNHRGFAKKRDARSIPAASTILRRAPKARYVTPLVQGSPRMTHLRCVTLTLDSVEEISGDSLWWRS